MKAASLLIYLSIAVRTSTALSADLRDLIANPGKYDAQKVDLVGIARVPGYFYLFADMEAAAKTDLSKALLIRKNNFGTKEYRELDRQWVRVTGILSSASRRGWDPGTGVLLDSAELLQDRPAPPIADRTVLAVFQNGTSEPLAIDLTPGSDGGRTTFFLKPHQTDKVPIDEGQAAASRLNGPDDVPLDKRHVGEPIASCEISFRGLPPGYQFSPEWSEKRTLYFRISNNRIEQVPSPKQENNKETGGK